MASRPRRRSTSSIRSHSGSISAQPSAAASPRARVSVVGLVERDRRGDVVAPGRHGDRDPRRVAAGAPRSRAVPATATASSGGMSAPPSPAMRSKRRVASRCQAGSRAGARPPRPARRRRVRGSSRVAASTASGISAGIDAALEPLARVGDDLMAAAGQRDADRIEQRALDEDARWWPRRSRSPRRRSRRPSTARPAASAITQSSGVDGVVACRSARGMSRRAPGRSVSTSPRQLRRVEHVQRTAEVDGEEIGDVDQRVDRPQADRDQPVLQPLRAGAVSHAADGAAEDPGAGLRPLDPPARAAVERGRRPLGGATASACPMPAAARSRAMPRTEKAVAAVRRDADLDHRVVEPRPVRVGHADRRVRRADR